MPALAGGLVREAICTKETDLLVVEDARKDGGRVKVGDAVALD